MKALIDKFLRKQTHQTLVQLFRYFFVGGLAFVFDFGTLLLLTKYLGVHYLYASAAGFLVGTCVNYLIAIRWVFTRHSLKDARLEFVIFAALGGIGLALNQGFMWLFTEHVGLHYTYSKLVTTAIVFLCNFFSRKLILYRDPH